MHIDNSVARLYIPPHMNNKTDVRTCMLNETGLKIEQKLLTSIISFGFHTPFTF